VGGGQVGAGGLALALGVPTVLAAGTVPTGPGAVAVPVGPDGSGAAAGPAGTGGPGTGCSGGALPAVAVAEAAASGIPPSGVVP
ncbi:MAG TPA: hypothetical protein VEZ42_19005, partial [Pseudonocardia sp.]|nr:hypothetical protein [Pseudonocardia sp.]